MKLSVEYYAQYTPNKTEMLAIPSLFSGVSYVGNTNFEFNFENLFKDFQKMHFVLRG